MNLNGVDAFFCTLGARQKHGAPQFFDVDYQYPYEFAQLASALKIPHFGIVSTRGAYWDSFSDYLRIKGEVEEDIKAL